LGYKEDEYVGHHISEFHSDAEVIQDILCRLEQNETLKDFSANLLSRNGEIKHVTISSNVYRKDGKFVHTRCFTHDVTEKVKAEKAQQKLEMMLIQSQKLEAIGTLAGGIAHDFNNLLVPILAMTEHVQQQLSSSSVEYKSLGIVVRSAQRAKELVSHILTSCRQNELRKETVVLGDIVKESITFLRTTIPANISIVQDINFGCPPILGDASQIHQIMVSLCVNAAHAMPNGGILKINLDNCKKSKFASTSESENDNSLVCLSVQDNGCGMNENTKSRIFDPFYTTKDAQSGTGLGLSMVLGIVEQHGGTIEVESIVGTGSIFRVYFDTIKDNYATVLINKNENKVVEGKGRILLVDDQPMVIQVGTLLLESIGYEVTKCLDPLKAVELLHHNPQAFDIIITDYKMPNLNGVAVIEKLRIISPGLPAILCTGDLDSLNLLSQSAINEVIMKPYGLAELSQAIKRMLKIW
jgi:signal transduction histidine kinase/CheY-like chemotaxis protein